MASPLKHLAQGSEIVLHHLIEPVWVQHVVYVGKDVSDVVVPVLHVLVESEVFDREVVEIGFELQVSGFPILRLFDTLLRRADSGVGEHQ